MNGTKPMLSGIFYVIGGINAITGLILCVSFWPGKDSIGTGYYRSEFLIALGWLVLGILSGFGWVWTGEVLAHMVSIKENQQEILVHLKALRNLSVDLEKHLVSIIRPNQETTRPGQSRTGKPES
jgi:hypothetical protein